MKIYLSAVETNSEHARALRDTRAPSILTSFYYARGIRGTRKQLWHQALYQAQLRLIDSGAFSWQEQAREGKVVGDHNKFFSDYLYWLAMCKDCRIADYWIELDIGMVVGVAWVQDHRKIWKKNGFGKGLIQVWHSMEHNWKDWEALIAEAQEPGRSNYVAIEGNRQERNPLDYDKFLAYARKKECRVHGFRLTSIEDNLLRYPFYSVDSTTWMTGVTFGTHLGRGKDGWLSLKRSSEPVWGSGKAPRHAGPKTRLDLLTRSARCWVELEQQVTRYWEKKGVRWAA